MSVSSATQAAPIAVNGNLPPVAAPAAPTVDDRIYACVVLGNILEWIKEASPHPFQCLYFAADL